MTRLALLLILLSSPVMACEIRDGLPDPACSPGAVDPSVTQENIQQTICRAGYSASVRPPVSVTNKIKRERMAAYGLAGQPMSKYELDHKLPLCLGGASDTDNLWPQIWDGPRGARAKDRLEDRLHHLVCQGQISLAEAQKVIIENWIEAYKKYVCEGGQSCIEALSSM